mgnify:FL=1
MNTTFKRLKQRLLTEETKAEKFNNWMLKIKSVHYANHLEMCNAYERLT